MSKLQDKNTREYRLYHNITTPEQEMQGLEAIIRNLKRERDEARRIACEMEERLGCDESGYPKNGTAREKAKGRGWDCFKEDIND
jgi:hypothetical protein